MYTSSNIGAGTILFIYWNARNCSPTPNTFCNLHNWCERLSSLSYPVNEPQTQPKMVSYVLSLGKSLQLRKLILKANGTEIETFFSSMTSTNFDADLIVLIRTFHCSKSSKFIQDNWGIWSCLSTSTYIVQHMLLSALNKILPSTCRN